MSCRQQDMHMLCFCIHSASQFLVGLFNPFTFKIIIDIYFPIDIFLTVLSLFFFVLLPIEVPLAFVVKLICWCYILLTFSCL